MATERRCKDCVAKGITSKRKLATNPDGSLAPGPRCVTHHREVKKARKVRAHELRVEARFELSAEEYDAILAAQGGRCAVCRRAKGLKRFLAVDHEHNKPGCTHPPDVGCRNCVRCLACDTCNRIVLGRYDIDALVRAIVVLSDPPAQKVLKALGQRPSCKEAQASREMNGVTV